MVKHELFQDVEDKDLQAHNRAAVMFNILEAGGRKLPAIQEVMVYLRFIPQEEKELAVYKLADVLGVKIDG